LKSVIFVINILDAVGQLVEGITLALKKIKKKKKKNIDHFELFTE
jgi:hypothetical protein